MWNSYQKRYIQRRQEDATTLLKIATNAKKLFIKILKFLWQFKCGFCVQNIKKNKTALKVRIFYA